MHNYRTRQLDKLTDNDSLQNRSSGGDRPGVVGVPSMGRFSTAMNDSAPSSKASSPSWLVNRCDENRGRPNGQVKLRSDYFCRLKPVFLTCRDLLAA